MRIMHGEFEIEADRHGSYSIRLNGKLVKRVTALSSYPGKPRWGNRKLEAEAIADAKRDVDTYVGMYGGPPAMPDVSAHPGSPAN